MNSFENTLSKNEIKNYQLECLAFLLKLKAQSKNWVTVVIDTQKRSELRNTFSLVSRHQRAWTNQKRWDSWTSFGHKIDTVSSTPHDCQEVARKIRNETKTCNSVWYSKSLSVNPGFSDLLFCGPMLKRLHSKQRQWLILCGFKRRFHVKISSSKNGQYLSTRRRKNFKSFFLSPMSCLLLLTILKARKVYM